MQRDPSRPGVFHDRTFGAVRKVPGVVFFDEEYIQAEPGLERQLFTNLEGKREGNRSETSPLDPPLYSSFVRQRRLRDLELLVVDRIRVRLSDRDGWELEPEVERWFATNVRLVIEVNRRPLAAVFLAEVLGDGYRLPRAGRSTDRWYSPRDPLCGDHEIEGRLVVLRDPGRHEANAIVRVEAVGAWLVEVRS